MTLAVLSLLLAAAAPAEIDAGFARLAAAAGQGAPVVRIGLDTGSKVTVSSSRPFRILDPGTGEAVWRPTHAEPVTAVSEAGRAGEVASVFRVQVGSFETEEAARAEVARLAAVVPEIARVAFDPDRSVWRVRLGAAGARDELSDLTERLRAAGVEESWIVEEPAEERSGGTLRLVDAHWQSLPTGLARVAVVPETGASVQVEGKAYRGVIELRISPYGTVRAIDWVERETYLRGVVPAELGPEIWPQLEALKAQAVAARTYLQANLGQFAREGFDLCATPRCQAYEGVKVEHPLSDQAVADTRGEVLEYEGTPIDALYTATCGGHTEDGAAVFADKKGLPYLKGVPCREDDGGRRAVELTGPAQEPRLDTTGTDVTLSWAWLRAAGVLRDEDIQGPLSGKRLQEWTRALAREAGLPAPAGRGHEGGTFAEAAAAAAADLGWDKRAEVLLLPGDADALLREGGEAPKGDALRRTLAYLAWMDAVHPGPEGTFGWEGPAEPARLAVLLARIAEAYDALDLQEGVLGGGADGGLRVVRDKEQRTLSLAPGAVLFGWAGGRALPVTHLRLLPGDRLRWHADADGRADVLELRPPVKGVADDRSAAVYAWEVRKTRRELEEAIGKRVRVGTLRDLKVVKRGVSGRIVALEVVGSRARQTVRGFDVRNLLDLRETLATFEIQRDRAGEITAVAFHGKGWGHGVGLCQVGAYGMALRGQGYRAILAHYYPGTTLSSAP